MLLVESAQLIQTTSNAFSYCYCFTQSEVVLRFTALRTDNGQICETFREACQRMGLLEDDAQRDATMTESTLDQSPVKLRNLFVLSLITCGPSNPEQFWDSYKKPLTEDFLLQARQRNPDIALN
jgi:hypothetical protein